MKTKSAGFSRLLLGSKLAPTATLIACALAAQTAAAQGQDASAAQLSHPTGESVERVPASQLKERCFLLASFAGDRPEEYDEVALAEGWTGVLKTFNDDDTWFMALCLGDEAPRAHVWYESPVEDGRFVASGPQFPPSWRIGEDDTLCLGGGDDAGCSIPYLHGDSGFLYLSFVSPESDGAEDDDGPGGTFWVVVQSDDGAPVYSGIEAALNAVAGQ